MKRIWLILTLFTLTNYASEHTHIQNACKNKKIATACYELSLYYEKGLGVEQSMTKSIEYKKRACQLKYEPACQVLRSLDK